MSRIGVPVFARDALFWCSALAIVALTPVLALAPGVALRPHIPAWRVWLISIGIYPVLEAVLFRAGLHTLLLHRLSFQWRGLSLANGITSLVFALAHLFAHPPAWALATFVPALLFGFFYERHGQRLAAPILLHMLANAAYLCLLYPS